MKKISLLSFAFLLALFFACRKDNLAVEGSDVLTDTTDYSDWTDATHSNNVEPNYDVVFNQNEVLRFDIKIDSEDWSAMQSDLSTVLGSQGGRPGEASSSENPMYVPCSFNFNGKQWYHVGIRYKGNSSLRSAFQSGNNKLSFKLDFDQFEDDYPTIKNQRFYGFKQLNLDNNFDDPSLVREKVGADLFRQFGLVSANTAFCVVYLDNGSGSQYYGVYALVEEVDNTVYKTQFAQSTGNLYKPEGNAATFANGTYKTDEFYLKTNEEAADYSDVKELYDNLNSSLRTTDAESWKTNLESVFNVDVFLKWLAANTVIQNWDTYGRMSHNFYLYSNPENGLLTWIPWDNNEAFQDGKMDGAVSLSLNEVDDRWPLINYIIAQPEYNATYKTYLKQFVTQVFIPDQMTNTYTKYYDLIKDYANAEESGYSYILNKSDFDLAVETLKSHVTDRNEAVTSYLQAKK